MLDKAGEKRFMQRYLLDELSTEQRVTFEDVYLKCNDVFQDLVAVENELIDNYVLGELRGPEQEKFEVSLAASPARREMVETARTLLAAAAEMKSGDL